MNGKGKEQGPENEAGGGGGGEHVNKAFMSSFYPLVIITSIICQTRPDILASRNCNVNIT